MNLAEGIDRCSVTTNFQRQDRQSTPIAKSWNRRTVLTEVDRFQKPVQPVPDLVDTSGWRRFSTLKLMSQLMMTWAKTIHFATIRISIRTI